MGVQFLAGERYFLFSIAALGPTQPPVEWLLGNVSPEDKKQGHDADHSPPSTAYVKNGGAILHPPPPPNKSSWCGASLSIGITLPSLPLLHWRLARD
jgi:hypothetical protein